MSDNRALVVGINGFSGRHLAAYLVQHGYIVAGIDLTPGTCSDLHVYVGDTRDSVFIEETLRTIRPTHIFHLAGLISAEAALDALYDVNVLGTERLLQAVYRADLDPLIVIPGSSAVYGPVKSVELPIRESQPFRPVNFYAVSKIAQEMLAYTYYAKHGLKVIRTRAFNLIGPGQPPALVGASFARQIAEIEAGFAEPVLRVGNLAPQRDFVDVRDVVRAYLLAAECGQPGEVYNVCSGRGISIQTCLDQLLALSKVSIVVEQDPDRVRTVDIPVSVGDGSLLREHTGWRATISLEQSLADLLADWRQRLREVRL